MFFLSTFSLSLCLFQLNLFKTFRVLLILPIFVLISMRSCLNTVGPVNPVPPVSVVSPVSTVSPVSHVSLAHPPASGACSGRKKSRARIYLISSMHTLSFTSKAFSSFFSFDWGAFGSEHNVVFSYCSLCSYKLSGQKSPILILSSQIFLLLKLSLCISAISLLLLYQF